MLLTELLYCIHACRSSAVVNFKKAYIERRYGMSISIKSVNCPQCGASVNYEEGREKLFCSYCGAQIIITNENEHIYRHIDEAEIKRAETERIETLADIENNKSSKVLLYAKYIATGLLLLLGIVLMIIGSNNGNSSLRLVGFLSLFASIIVM